MKNYYMSYPMIIKKIQTELLDLKIQDYFFIKRFLDRFFLIDNIQSMLKKITFLECRYEKDVVYFSFNIEIGINNISNFINISVFNGEISTKSLTSNISKIDDVYLNFSIDLKDKDILYDNLIRYDKNLKLIKRFNV